LYDTLCCPINNDGGTAFFWCTQANPNKDGESSLGHFLHLKGLISAYPFLRLRKRLNPRDAAPINLKLPVDRF